MRAQLSSLDRFLVVADDALRTLSGGQIASRPAPAAVPDTELSQDERKLSGALMRVNHVGEVCAQALYRSQALATRNPSLRNKFEAAADEEGDHLGWTQHRLRDLGARPSVLNPLWYAGAFALGLIAGRAGDRASLGFVVETERQVERHLANHMSRLPAGDHGSRAIVEQMKLDEARHGEEARAEGALPLPLPARLLMRGAAKLMTTVAHRI